MDAVDLVQRAEMVLQNAEQLDCRVFVRPQDIVSGSQRLNLAFLANLFHGYPALDKPPHVEEKVAEMEETREEKSECTGCCCAPFLPQKINGKTISRLLNIYIHFKVCSSRLSIANYHLNRITGNHGTYDLTKQVVPISTEGTFISYISSY